MTKTRAPSTFADAITRIAGQIGWAAMADVVGKGERAVRNWSDPDMDRAPSIADALALDAAYLADGGGEPPLLAVYQLMLDRRVTPAACSAELVQATGLVAKEAGEAVAAAVLASQAGASATDRAIAEREVGQAVDALTNLQRKLGGQVTP